MSALDEEFSKLPHSLLNRALSLGLTGCEWDVLLLLVRFAYGFHNEECAASLTRLERKCTRSRRQISRALQRLCELELIELWQEPTYRRAGQYRILEQSGVDATVAQTPQSHTRHTEEPDIDIDMDTSATPSGIDATQSGMDATPEVTPAPLRVACTPHIKDNRYKDTSGKIPGKENGCIDMSVASGNATSPTLVLASPSKGASPLTPPGLTPLDPKSNGNGHKQDHQDYLDQKYVEELADYYTAEMNEVFTAPLTREQRQTILAERDRLRAEGIGSLRNLLPKAILYVQGKGIKAKLLPYRKGKTNDAQERFCAFVLNSCEYGTR